MKVDFEEPLDSIKDILRLGRKFYSPKGTFFYEQFKASPIPEYNQLAEEIVKKNTFFLYDQTGNVPAELEKDILE